MPERSVHANAGRKPKPEDLLSLQEITRRYLGAPTANHPVKNGTSGHRGLLGEGFTEAHVAAMTQALADIRREKGTFGPVLPESLAGKPPGPIVMGKDVRYASDLAQITAAEVFAGNGMQVLVHQGGRSTPTPVVSHAILTRVAAGEKAEGVVITASHNPPEEGGMKSNGLDGGPNTATKAIDEKAAAYLQETAGIKRLAYDQARAAGLVREIDLLTPYVKDLAAVVDMDLIKRGRFGVTPLGGSSAGYYEAVNAMHGTDIHVVLPDPDPASVNRTYDWDGKLRGDPSSLYVMMAVQGMREQHGLTFIGANDNDADRFGGEDATGILSPNHILCVLLNYLIANRPGFKGNVVGRSIGTTHMLDRIAAARSTPRRKIEVQEENVGFKHFVSGLSEGRYILAGEESAGLSLPRRDGTTWVTEKDGIAAVLLMLEVMAKTGKDIGALYRELEEEKGIGPHQYERVDVPADAAKKARLNYLAAHPDEVRALLEGKTVAGRAVKRLRIGDGIKVVLEGEVWVLKRASGTEDLIKDYREEPGKSLATARQASTEIDRLLGLV